MYVIGVKLVTFLFLNIIKIDCSRLRTLEAKVVGGSHAKINDYPHAVFLKIVIDKNNVVICGSSVLNQMVLLTVAHCFEKVGSKTVIIAYAGHENLNKASITRKATKTHIHERYNEWNAANDIALVLLNKILPLGRNVKRVIIRRNFKSDAEASLAGWGIINESPERETITLKSITQKLQRASTCKPLKMVKGMMCAGSVAAKQPRPASGDSGSGLVTKTHLLIGLLSFKVMKYPALPVYTNVSHYYGWLRKNLQKLC